LHVIFAILTPEDTARKARYHWTIDKGKFTPDPLSDKALVDFTGLPDGTPVQVSFSVIGFGWELKGSGVIYVGGNKARCPTVKITPSSATAPPGKAITFTSKIENGLPGLDHTYNWQVEGGGVIGSGQGTPSITVEETDKLKPGTRIRATVDVRGLPGCETTNTATVEIAAATARKIDEFAGLVGRAEKDRLDQLMLQLVIHQSDIAYVMVYSGPTTPKGSAASNMRRIRNIVEGWGGIVAPRVRVVDGGRRDKPTREIWLVPPGAAPPKPTRSVDL
jgi:hypothetical protein